MHPGQTLEDRIEGFLAEKEKYQLGDLLTEQGHELTQNLSQQAQADPQEGLKSIFSVDHSALSSLLKDHLPKIQAIRVAVQSALSDGGRVFLGGCGATGRLSVSLERLWRESNPCRPDSVIGFIAGGDVAFVHAIEGFEDYPEYGAHQLRDLGFQQNDLFIGITEGGETPFVIGATQEAAKLSSRKALFAFSNPMSLLKEKVQRSREIMENSNVESFEFPTGAMALAGSTRMQSSTILMLVVGLALLNQNDAEAWVEEIKRSLSQIDLSALADFSVWESDVYLKSEQTVYVCDEYAATVFTDTTERSPTFSLASFDNDLWPQKVSSLTYVSIPTATHSEEAWEHLFFRAPRTLEWSEEFKKTRKEYMLGFDFSNQALFKRQKLAGDKSVHQIRVREMPAEILIEYNQKSLKVSTEGLDLLARHILLKMILNAHSTLLMGRLKRYVSHFMTYVVPSNGKLVDRATRYTLQLAAQDGLSLDYDEVARTILQAQSEIEVGEPVVLEALNRFKD